MSHLDQTLARPERVAPAMLSGAARWLKSPRGHIAVMVAALIALALPAIHPYLFGSLPRTDDLLQHIHRLIALDYAIRHGDLWPRYVATLLYGYGEPIFNYYSPLSLYPFEFVHLLGFSFQTAVLIGLSFYVLLGLAGAYLLGDGWGGPIAGIGAAAAYTYAPYLIFNGLHRGAVGEIAGLALLPWVLWSIHWLARRGSRIAFVAALAILSALILTHNITAILGGALAVIYALFVWWTCPNPPRFFVQMVLVGILALGVTAFYWLPALAESSYVQLDRTRVGVQNPPDAPEFNDEFQTLPETFALPRPADLTWFNPPVQRTLGWPQVALSLGGLILFVIARPPSPEDRARRSLMILLLILVAAMLFMTTRVTGPIWAGVPLIHFVQFPWRLLGPISLLLALMSGITLGAIADRLRVAPGQVAWLVVMLAVIVIYAMPWLYQLYIPDPAISGVVDSLNYERKTGRLGGTAGGEFTPVWSQELPDPNRLKPLFIQNEVIPRLRPNAALTVSKASWGPTSADLTFSAQSDATLVFDWLYFPGWGAQLDGKSAPIGAAPRRGLLTVAVPAGEHRLTVSFGPTPLRFGASVASLVCLALAAMLILAVRQFWPEEATSPPTDKEWKARLHVPAAALLAGVLLFVFKVALIDNISSPIKAARFANGLQAGLQTPLQFAFGREVTLLGYDHPRSQVASGQSISVALYWQPTSRVISQDYSSALYLRDPSGNIIAEVDEFYPGGWATSNWVPGFYVRQPLTLAVPPGTPPGTYTLAASLYSPAESRSLEVTDVDGNPQGVLAVLGELEVTRPSQPIPLVVPGGDAGQPLVKINARLVPTISLIAANAPPAAVTVGDDLPIMALWRAESPPAADYTFAVVWLDANAQPAATSTPRPLVVGYPASQWQAGDQWRGLSHFYVPGRLLAGSYTAVVQLFDPTGEPQGERAILGQVQVSTPQRTFVPPHRSVTADVSWDNGIALIGYDISEPAILPGRTLLLNLYWLPRSDLDASLTLFVHMVSADGKIIAQTDTIPAAGARPTTGWMPGEIIVDHLSFVVPIGAPAGRCWFRVGWYDTATGGRVPVSGEDFWILPDIVRVISGS